MRIKETITTTIDGQGVEIINDGIAYLKDQNEDGGTEGKLEMVKEMIKESLDKGMTKDWIPYANFEASITWSIVPSKEEILEEMELHNNDEVGIDNQWDYEEAEYHLLLSDKYHSSQSSDNTPPPHTEADVPHLDEEE